MKESIDRYTNEATDEKETVDNKKLVLSLRFSNNTILLHLDVLMSFGEHSKKAKWRDTRFRLGDTSQVALILHASVSSCVKWDHNRTSLRVAVPISCVIAGSEDV